MKFGIFYEHQLPQPWAEGDEQRLFQEALDQVELADHLGIDAVWEVEHHFLDEYSHSSAPEVFLGACSQRTKKIRLGHGIVQMPPAYNHPARVAERIATLDLVSNGRVEWGTGESAAVLEMGGFNIPAGEKRAMYKEATEQAANMIAMTPYPGYEGRYVKMPCRNIVPKPVQRPHPPMWMACSRRESIHDAARMGMGALTFSFVDPSEARKWVGEYYEILKKECVPIGHTVNANVAMVTGFSCHPDQEEAESRGLDGLQFFNYALGHHYFFGDHKPGFTNIWNHYESVRATLPPPPDACIGTPEHIRNQLLKFSEAGVDQVIFIQQGGRNKHQHICESLQHFSKKVMPEFHQGEAEREETKSRELAPFITEALGRKERMKPMRWRDAPRVSAQGG